jgi:hypothetical protein
MGQLHETESTGNERVRQRPLLPLLLPSSRIQVQCTGPFRFADAASGFLVGFFSES